MQFVHTANNMNIQTAHGFHFSKFLFLKHHELRKYVNIFLKIYFLFKLFKKRVIRRNLCVYVLLYILTINFL